MNTAQGSPLTNLAGMVVQECANCLIQVLLKLAGANTTLGQQEEAEGVLREALKVWKAIQACYTLLQTTGIESNFLDKLYSSLLYLAADNMFSKCSLLSVL